MSMYPPGVTGREYEIAGPDAEWEDERECGREGVTLPVMSPHALKTLKQHVAAARENDVGEATLRLWLETAVDEMTEYPMDECPFTGEVLIEAFEGIERWDCPLCGASHEADQEPPEPEVEMPDGRVLP